MSKDALRRSAMSGALLARQAVELEQKASAVLSLAPSYERAIAAIDEMMTEAHPEWATFVAEEDEND